MAALLALAARMIAAVVGSRAALVGVGTAAALDIGPFGGAPVGIPFLGGGARARRRRRRALTASDKADIAFISGTLGKPAGRDFAMIVAART